MRNTKLFVVVIALQTIAVPPVCAELFKWKDDQGTITYSATPPNGRDAQRMHAKSALSTSTNCTTAQCAEIEARRSERRYRSEQSVINRQNRAMLAKEGARAYDAHKEALDKEHAKRRSARAPGL